MGSGFWGHAKYFTSPSAVWKVGVAKGLVERSEDSSIVFKSERKECVTIGGEGLKSYREIMDDIKNVQFWLLFNFEKVQFSKNLSNLFYF